MALAKFSEETAFGNFDEWKAGFHTENGYAVPNRFEAIITTPPKMGARTITNPSHGSERKSDVRSISLRCESVNLPGINLNTLTDSNIYGPTREIVDGVTYAEDITMVFPASSGLEERVFFEEWQKQAFDATTWNIGYYNDYVSVIDLYLLNRQNKRRFGLRIHEAFPKTIGPTDLSQAASNEIIKISVSFSFRYWSTLDIERTPENIEKRILDVNINSVTRANIRSQPAVNQKLGGTAPSNRSHGSFGQRG
jgi:hypothetical protein